MLRMGLISYFLCRSASIAVPRFWRDATGWIMCGASIAIRCSRPRILSRSPFTTRTINPPPEVFGSLPLRAYPERVTTSCRQRLAKPAMLETMEPLRIVAIGGGTGLSTLLHGLKRYAAEPREIEITAVVTVTDDGGSSGRLRREFDVLPPGDIRNCLVALSEDEATLSKLFQYRFSEGRGLKGHSFGNLFLTALTHQTCDFATAVQS